MPYVYRRANAPTYRKHNHMTTRFNLLFYALLFCAYPLFAQPLLTLKNIFQEQTFQEKTAGLLRFHPDGRHFARLDGRQIRLFRLDDGAETSVLFTAPENIRLSDFQFGPRGERLLLQTKTEKLYRRSVRAHYLVYHIERRELTPVLEAGKQRYAAFSPDGRKVAFVFENDLYYRDLATGKLIRVTEDGAVDRIINGAADWVYEEEFSLTQAFAWSPDGRYLAYLRFDESAVPAFTMANYRGGVYPEYVTWKYPKVGQAAAAVSAHLFDLQTAQVQAIDLPASEAPYLPRIGWSPDGRVYLLRMNRHQNQLELWLSDTSGQVRNLLTERDEAYLDLHDDLTFLPGERGFLWTSERDGWNHLYHFDRNGRLIAQLTKGEWEIDQIIGYDAQNNQIYYRSTEKSPLERHIYRIGTDGRDKQLLIAESGWHDARFAPGFQYFLHTFSTVKQPPAYSIRTHDGARKYWLEENKALQALMQINKTVPVDFWDFKTDNGDRLNGWMIKPPDFSKDRRYPVLMYVYGGPGSQRAADRWNAMRDYWWFQLLAHNGYVIAGVDNRGTGGRGAQFQKQTYLKLGQYEVEDQIAAARYLAKQSYVDPEQIGIYGKSYGGYMAALCLLRGGPVFSAGISLAPVTHWQWYDCVYTERYMRTVEENPEGYERGAPVASADQLVDPFLLIHGLGDDNVHFQHSAELARALTAANKPFETHFYPNINHSLRGGNTALHLYTKMTDFLDRHLRQTDQRSLEYRGPAQRSPVDPRLRDQRYMRPTPEQLRKMGRVKKKESGGR